VKVLTKPPEERSMYVTTMRGCNSHKAVIVWWNPHEGGFWEPWLTGCPRPTLPEAAAEARDMANAFGYGYLPSKEAVV
jgi:hypothetical protein